MKYLTSTQEGIKLLLLLLFMLSGIVLSAQSKKELEEQRKQLIKEIQQTESKLKEAQKNKEAALERYVTLQSKIQKRQQLVRTLRAEISYADSSMKRTEEVIGALRQDIDQLKEEYASTVRTAFRLKLNKGILLFLFSAKDFNDAFSRWQYIRQYNNYRNRQARVIMDTQQMLEDKAEQLREDTQKKAKLLSEQVQQSDLLSKELKDKDKLLTTFKKSESKLLAELEAQQKARRELNSAIEAVIKKEMAKMRAEARKPVAAASKEVKANNALGSSFAQARGRLTWPVSTGKIVKFFGPQPHPTLKRIKIVNNGIDIKTAPSSDVLAVYSGKVAGTQFIPGYQNMIILQHGKYYTVYSKLEEIYVKRGEAVSAQQVIGKLGASKDVVHFEIWREKKRLDPVIWVSKR